MDFQNMLKGPAAAALCAALLAGCEEQQPPPTTQAPEPAQTEDDLTVAEPEPEFRELEPQDQQQAFDQPEPDQPQAFDQAFDEPQPDQQQESPYSLTADQPQDQATQPDQLQGRWVTQGDQTDARHELNFTNQGRTAVWTQRSDGQTTRREFQVQPDDLSLEPADQGEPAELNMDERGQLVLEPADGEAITFRRSGQQQRGIEADYSPSEQQQQQQQREGAQPLEPTDAQQQRDQVDPLAPADPQPQPEGGADAEPLEPAGQAQPDSQTEPLAPAREPTQPQGEGEAGAEPLEPVDEQQQR